MLAMLFSARNSNAAERNAAGVDFINGIKNLTEPTRSRLLGGGGVPFSSLPGGMQDATKKMVAALASEYGEKGGFKPGKDVASLSGSKINLKTTPKEGFTDYGLEYSAPGVGCNFSFNDYDAKREKNDEKNEALAKDGKVGAVFAPEKHSLSRKELLKVATLQQIVSLNMNRVSFVGVLQKLHEKYRISFIGPDPKDAPEKADVNLTPMTLLEAIDRLEKLYPKAKWMWTRGDFLVVRGPFGNRKRETHSESELKLR